MLVVVAGQRLSAYIAQSVGELGFLRGVWLDSSLRLTWLEDYAAALEEHATAAPPDRLVDGHPLRARLVPLPGHRPAARSRTSTSRSRPAPSWPIVGENGAGKSTLVKLLAGMYRPTSGRITVDGVDLATMSDARRGGERLAGAFQDFFRFELVARQSVGVGDEPRLDDEPAVVGAVDRAGADDVVERLPAGLDTQLGPTWDDGVEVSFGQWQKLALARGFMRDEPLVLVLDEPTAALDAETEHALFERYAGAAHDADRQRPHHRARVAPLLDRAHGRPDRRARRRPRRRGRPPRRAASPRAASTPSSSRSRPAPTAERRSGHRQSPGLVRCRIGSGHGRVDDELLNRVTWKIPNALALVGSRAGDEWNGMTTSWITQVSMEPVLIGVGVDNSAVTHRLITAGGSFTVNLWSADDTRVFVKFSKPATFDAAAMTLNDRPVRAEVTGAPVFADAIAWMDCAVRSSHDFGTHTLFVGEVVAAGVRRRRGPRRVDERHPHEVRRRQAPLAASEAQLPSPGGRRRRHHARFARRHAPPRSSPSPATTAASSSAPMRRPRSSGAPPSSTGSSISPSRCTACRPGSARWPTR